jgi:hypothetical protein
MDSEQNNYSPWERTEIEDLQIMKTLDNVSENQFSSLVDELLSIADELPD